MGTLSLEGSVVVVTGASRGIGRAVATAAAARGARVGLIARTSSDLQAVLDECGGAGALATADVADPAQIGEALDQLESLLGPVDVLVANAGIGAYGAFVDVAPEQIERVVGVNVLGTMHTIRAAAPGMVARRRGHIVVVGSIAGRIGAPFEALYSATKFAQVGFTEALSVELSPYGIGVSVVNPGPVATDFFDARGHAYSRSTPKPVPPEQIASAVIAAVEKGLFEQVRPRWLRQAVVVRHLVPAMYRWGTRRTFRTELAADVAGRTASDPDR